MSIQVKHEGNATPSAFASVEGGIAKRRAQEGAQMAATMQQAANAGNQQLRGASAPGATPGRSNAQLMHAQAPIGSGGGGGSHGGGGGKSSSGNYSPPTTPQTKYKLLGGSRLDGAPTPGAFWSDNNNGWMRPYRPGEMEAEAFGRKLSMQYAYDNLTSRREVANKIAIQDNAAGNQMAVNNNDLMNKMFSVFGGTRMNLATHPQITQSQNAFGSGMSFGAAQPSVSTNINYANGERYYGNGGVVARPVDQEVEVNRQNIDGGLHSQYQQALEAAKKAAMERSRGLGAIDSESAFGDGYNSEIMTNKSIFDILENKF